MLASIIHVLLLPDNIVHFNKGSLKTIYKESLRAGSRCLEPIETYLMGGLDFCDALIQITHLGNHF